MVRLLKAASLIQIRDASGVERLHIHAAARLVCPRLSHTANSHAPCSCASGAGTVKAANAAGVKTFPL